MKLPSTQIGRALLVNIILSLIILSYGLWAYDLVSYLSITGVIMAVFLLVIWVNNGKQITYWYSE